MVKMTMPILVSCLLLLTSCASLYFRPVTPPREPFKVHDLGGLTYSELWSGFIFNGEKIGFTYLKIEPQEGKLFRITSEAHMRIRFLGLDKRIQMKSVDIVRPDLTLVSFYFEQKLGEKPMVLEGEIADGHLTGFQRTGAQTKTLEERVEEPIYPAAIINLYPVLHGMKIGAKYRYRIFDHQVQALVDISQSVESFEESSRLALEPSFKVNTRIHGYLVSTWINLRGEAIFEKALGGVLLTYKEDEDVARQYLSEASLNKKDLILDFSLVRTERPIPCPRNATFLEVSLEGISERLPLLHGPGQEVREMKTDGRIMTVYRIQSDLGSDVKTTEVSPAPSDLKKYLASTYHIESGHPDIKRTANNVVSGARTSMEKVQRLVHWVSEEVKDAAEDSVSALEVLHQRKGECQAHTLLYTALARSQGIPTRLIGGLVYAEDLGFLYHGWAESFVDGWRAVDPTFDQVGVDATHIKLVEGESWISLIKLGRVIGGVKAAVIDFQVSCRPN